MIVICKAISNETTKQLLSQSTRSISSLPYEIKKQLNNVPIMQSIIDSFDQLTEQSTNQPTF